MPHHLSNIRAVIMDADGVLWRGDTPIDGASRWISHLQAQGIPYIIATNNSSKSPQEYQQKLERLQIARVTPEHIVSSGMVTASFLAREYPAGATVFVVGGDGLRELIAAAGMTLVTDEQPDVVVVGIDFALTYDKLRRASDFIRRGARFIGTNADRTFPLPEGPAPGAGSILALLQTATDVAPEVMGKPGRAMFETALAVMGAAAEHTLMIGDRMDTDILGAIDAGLMTALVLTGVDTRDTARTYPTQPDIITPDLNALLDTWLGVKS
ncbi:MAG: HAD-IIA family hydrolase [Pleurocapsa minor GSE-CHR-MK-17-07R]|nr:HAD-IIA family hydrolase [Pleurocapsa minor GSE-CHR-MK 17-07R]